MGLLGDSHSEKELIATVKLQAETIDRLTRREPPHQRVKQVLITIFNNSKFINMSNLALVIGAGEYPIIAALVDSTSLQPIPGAVPTLVSNTSDTPAVAVIGADGNLQPVSAGTGNVIAINSWAYTDQVTNQPVTGLQLTTTQPFSVTQTAEGVLQVITLGPPVPIPAATAAAVKA